MDWSRVRDIIGSAAPVLGTVLGGPAGAAIGGIVAAALGTDNTPEAVIEKLNNDPEAMVKVLEIESNQKVELMRLSVAAEQNKLVAATTDLQTIMADKASARQLVTVGGDYTARNLAYIYTFMLFIIIMIHFGMMAMKVELDPLALQVIATLEGVLISVALGAKEFFFGSSLSDQKKAEDISQIAKS